MEHDDGQHRSSGRAINDGQKTRSEPNVHVGYNNGAEMAHEIGCGVDIDTTSHSAGPRMPNEKGHYDDK